MYIILFLQVKNKSNPVMDDHHFGAVGVFLSGGDRFNQS
jgi:hypothetical protein